MEIVTETEINYNSSPNKSNTQSPIFTKKIRKNLSAQSLRQPRANSQLFSPDNVIECLFFQTGNLKSVPLKSVLPEDPQNANDILISEIAEYSKPYIRSLNVSLIDPAIIASNPDARKVFQLASSQTPSILDSIKNAKNENKGFNQVIDLENKVINEQCKPVSSAAKGVSLRENLNQLLIQAARCELIGFFQAFQEFNKIETDSLKRKPLYVSSIFTGLCSCFNGKTRLDEQSEEICEKLVRFAFTQFNFSNVFHKNLLISACVKAFKVSEVPENPEAILSDLLLKVNKDSEVLLMGFFNVLFLDCFFPEVLEALEGEAKGRKDDVLSLVCKLSLENLTFLRKDLISDMIMRSQKCFELIFFMFAGVCLYYLELVKAEGCEKKALKKLGKTSSKMLVEVLGMARREYIHQATQV